MNTLDVSSVHYVGPKPEAMNNKILTLDILTLWLQVWDVGLKLVRFPVWAQQLYWVVSTLLGFKIYVPCTRLMVILYVRILLLYLDICTRYMMKRVLTKVHERNVPVFITKFMK